MSAAASSTAAIRQDLEILHGPSSAGSEPDFIIADHVRHRYFRIGRRALELLAGQGAAAGPKKDAAMANGAEAEELAQFLNNNQLADDTEAASWQKLWQTSKRGEHGMGHAILHGYLFFRVPLFRPQRFLDAAWPFVSFLFTRTFAVVCGVLAVLALALLSRRWDAFVHTFTSFLSLEGAATYGVSLVLVKCLHELGHAFMARKYGTRVTTIGVAFMVLFPVLYTDTSSSWRLERRKRLMISAAGIMTELAIAVVATLSWIFLPDGPLRAAAFATATISWVMSLAVNLNPLMRFDGYYLFSDLTGIENLQERSFARARWSLRETLFGFGDDAPEPLPRRTAFIMLAHAYATWIYRFFLFLGIAILVYHFFIKPVALVLFAVEMGWFILLPVWRELAAWWQRRGDMRVNRQSLRAAAGVAVILAILFVPWQGSVAVPAMLRGAELGAVHAKRAARIASIRVAPGDRVAAGDVLFGLEAPDAPHERDAALADRDAIAIRLKRLAADNDSRSERVVLESQLQAARKRLAALADMERELVVTAPVSGLYVNANPHLAPGIWVSPTRRLGVVVSDRQLVLDGYAAESTRPRLAQDAQAVFIPEEPELERREAILTAIAQSNAAELALPPLADRHGGPIAVLDSPQGKLEPVGAWYPVRFSVVSHDPPAHAVRGTVHVTAGRVSIASRIFRRVAGTLIRESGF